MRDRRGQRLRDGKRSEDAKHAPDRSGDPGFRQEKEPDLGAARTEGAEGADLGAAADDGGRDRVVDQEHPDEKRDETQRAQIQLESAEHGLDLLTASGGRGNRYVAGNDFLQSGGSRLERLRIDEEKDRRQLARSTEKLLRPADVHRDRARIQARGSVLGIDHEEWIERARPAVREDLDGATSTKRLGERG